MSSNVSIWVNGDVDDGKLGHLLQITQEGLRFAFDTSAKVSGWEARIRSGESVDSVTAPFGPIPWPNIDWLEWSNDGEVRFRYTVPGHGSHTTKYETASPEQLEEISQSLLGMGIFRASQRSRSTFEIVKGPGIQSGIILFLGSTLLWFVGGEARGGMGRAAAREAIFVSIANGLGYVGISLLMLAGLVGIGIYTALRLRNPPVVHRLER